jgi:hypothetical protein
MISPLEIPLPQIESSLASKPQTAIHLTSMRALIGAHPEEPALSEVEWGIYCLLRWVGCKRSPGQEAFAFLVVIPEGDLLLLLLLLLLLPLRLLLLVAVAVAFAFAAR